MLVEKREKAVKRKRISRQFNQQKEEKENNNNNIHNNDDEKRTYIVESAKTPESGWFSAMPVCFALFFSSLHVHVFYTQIHAKQTKKCSSVEKKVECKKVASGRERKKGRSRKKSKKIILQAKVYIQPLDRNIMEASKSKRHLFFSRVVWQWHATGVQYNHCNNHMPYKHE